MAHRASAFRFQSLKSCCYGSTDRDRKWRDNFREIPISLYSLIKAHQCEQQILGELEMPRRQRQQRQDGQPTSPSTTREEREQQQATETHHDALDEINEEENPESTSSRSKGLKGFLKHAKNQQYRVVETRVALVCSFGIFFKLIYSEGLEELDESKELFTTHAAVTYVGRKYKQRIKENIS